MSVLDMFASALGAFIMCAIVLLPYFKPNLTEKLKAAKVEVAAKKIIFDNKKAQATATTGKAEELQRAYEKLRSGAQNMKECRTGLNQCQVRLAKNFLLVQISWHTEINVDLHVTANGREFYFYKTNRNGRDFPDTKATLSFDSTGTSSGGVEVWVDPSIVPGAYVIEYVLDRPTANPVVVDGVYFDRHGRKVLPTRTLQAGDTRIRAGTITVASDQSVSFR